MTSYVEQDRQPRRICGVWRLAPSRASWPWASSGCHRSKAPPCLLKVGCTLALWASALTELAVTGHRVRQARAAERRAEHTLQVLAEALDVLPRPSPSSIPPTVRSWSTSACRTPWDRYPHGGAPDLAEDPSGDQRALPCPTGAGSGSTGIAPATATGSRSAAT